MSCHCHCSHKADCKHENVKYCSVCYKCYCVDCGTEWPNQYYPYWSIYPPVYIPSVWAPDTYKPTWTVTSSSTYVPKDAQVSYTAN